MNLILSGIFVSLCFSYTLFACDADSLKTVANSGISSSKINQTAYKRVLELAHEKETLYQMAMSRSGLWNYSNLYEENKKHFEIAITDLEGFGIIGASALFHIAIDPTEKVRTRSLATDMLSSLSAGKEFIPELIQEATNRLDIVIHNIDLNSIEPDMFPLEKGVYPKKTSPSIKAQIGGVFNDSEMLASHLLEHIGRMGANDERIQSFYFTTLRRLVELNSPGDYYSFERMKGSSIIEKIFEWKNPEVTKSLRELLGNLSILHAAKVSVLLKGIRSVGGNIPKEFELLIK